MAVEVDAASAVPRQMGRVKWFDVQRGWGFIQPNDGSDDIFVHQQSICAQGFRSLDDGESVEFETETDSMGRKRAVNVSGPNRAPVRGSSRPNAFASGGGGGGGRPGSRDPYSGGGPPSDGRRRFRGGQAPWAGDEYPQQEGSRRPREYNVGSPDYNNNNNSSGPRTRGGPPQQRYRDPY